MQQPLVHAWNLDVYVNIDQSTRNTLRKKMNQLGLSSVKLSKLTGISKQTILGLLNGHSVKRWRFFRIAEALEIPKEHAETYITKLYCIKYELPIKFPFELTPMHIRLVSHAIGDGCIEDKTGCRWIQKSEVGGNMYVNLVKNVIGVDIVRNKTFYAYSLPEILIKMVCSALGIPREQLKTRFFDEVSKLNPDFCVQAVAAFVVDEGSIKRADVNVCNTDMNIMKGFLKILDALGYSHSTIRLSHNDSDNKKFIMGKLCNVNAPLYKIYINGEGVYKFKEELDCSINKYGITAGLWQKQNKLDAAYTKIGLSLIHERRKTREIVPHVLELAKSGPIIASELSIRYNLSYYRSYKILYNLCKKGMMKCAYHGTFVLPSYAGDIQVSIRDKIRSLMTTDIISVQEVARLSELKPEIVSTTLSQFTKMGITERIDKGFT